MNKTQIVSLLTVIAAAANTIYGFIDGNAGILTDFGISPKWNQVIFFIGLIATSLSSSLTKKKSDEESASRIGGGGIRNPDPK